MSEKTKLLPSELFHYTSFDTAKKILESQTLWATDFRHLNDATEFHHAKPRLEDLLAKAIKMRLETADAVEKEFYRQQGGIDAIAIEEASRIMRAFFETAFRGRGLFPGYIASFCSHENEPYENKNGLLSMWRGYGKDGVALVFDTAKLKEHIEEEKSRYPFSDILFDWARYDISDKDFSDILDSTFLDKCVELLYASLDGDDGRAQSLMPLLFESLVPMAAFFKHRAFFEEREARIVALPWDERHLDAASPERRGPIKEFKTSPSGRPYIKLFNDAQPLPITRIIVGPQSAQDERVKELKQLTKGCGITIDRSETPYRPNGDAKTWWTTFLHAFTLTPWRVKVPAAI